MASPVERHELKPREYTSERSVRQAADIPELLGARAPRIAGAGRWHVLASHSAWSRRARPQYLERSRRASGTTSLRHSGANSLSRAPVRPWSGRRSYPRCQQRTCFGRHPGLPNRLSVPFLASASSVAGVTLPPMTRATIVCSLLGASTSASQLWLRCVAVPAWSCSIPTEDLAWLLYSRRIIFRQ